MCLILFAWKAHPGYELVVAANRDEWRDRPAAPAQWWDDTPHVLGGRDLKAGGTWLGVTRNGRFAALTNFRDPADRQSTAPSRGTLVTDFLRDKRTPHEFLEALATRAGQFNGFNLIAGDGTTLVCFGSRDASVRDIEPGVHGLSNHLLDEPWPKVTQGRNELGEIMKGGVDIEALFGILSDRRVAANDQLPNTGVGIERERDLAPALIVTPDYGTRCSTVLLMAPDGHVVFDERTRGADGSVVGRVSYRFQITR